MNISGEIKCFLGDGDYAQLKFSESGTSFSLDIIMVPSSHRNKGVGTILVNRLLVMADSMNKDIFVSVRPIGNNSEETLRRLVRYYEHFGFETYDTGLTTVFMVRKASSDMPRKFPQH